MKPKNNIPARNKMLMCIDADGKYYTVKGTNILTINVFQAYGVWQLTRKFNEGGGPKRQDLKDLIAALLNKPNRKVLRGLILDRLTCMGASGGLAFLRDTQYKSFYNFLNTLR